MKGFLLNSGFMQQKLFFYCDYSPLGFSRHYLSQFCRPDLFQTSPTNLALILGKYIRDIFILTFGSFLCPFSSGVYEQGGDVTLQFLRLRGEKY